MPFNSAKMSRVLVVICINMVLLYASPPKSGHIQNQRNGDLMPNSETNPQYSGVPLITLQQNQPKSHDNGGESSTDSFKNLFDTHEVYNQKFHF